MTDLAFLRRIKKLVIQAVFSEPHLRDLLVLKGGNLLDVVYDISARASLDIDLSTPANFSDPQRIEDLIRESLCAIFTSDKLVVFDFQMRFMPPEVSEDLLDFWGGYRIEFKLIREDDFTRLRDDITRLRRAAETLGKRGSTKFKIDISCHEFCGDKELFEVDNWTLYGYSPAMFIAEKLRAICQQMEEYVALVRSHSRPRARDFLDIYIVSTQYGIDWNHPNFLTTVRKVFEAKKVPVRLLAKLPDTRDQHEGDFTSVKDTILPGSDIQDFDFYFEYLCRKLSALESLGNEDLP